MYVLCCPDCHDESPLPNHAPREGELLWCDTCHWTFIVGQDGGDVFITESIDSYPIRDEEGQPPGLIMNDILFTVTVEEHDVEQDGGLMLPGDEPTDLFDRDGYEYFTPWEE